MCRAGDEKPASALPSHNPHFSIRPRQKMGTKNYLPLLASKANARQDSQRESAKSRRTKRPNVPNSNEPSPVDQMESRLSPTADRSRELAWRPENALKQLFAMGRYSLPPMAHSKITPKQNTYKSETH